MASKMLMKDLENLKQKYKNKVSYFAKKLRENYNHFEDKKLFAQYSYCLDAYRETEIIIATHERVFGNGNKN